MKKLTTSILNPIDLPNKFSKTSYLLNIFFLSWLSLQICPSSLAKELLIFDEIQAEPNAITSLKYFAEELPELHLVAAGSLLGLELAPTSYPVGKAEFLDLFPMSFLEFLLAVKEQPLVDYFENFNLGEPVPEAIHHKSWQLMLDYFAVGGLPASVSAFELAEEKATGYKASRQVLNNLIFLYQSDFTKHSGKENALHIERVFSSVPEQLAQAVDMNVKKYQFKDVIHKKGRYSSVEGPISWLKKASLLLQVPITEVVKSPIWLPSVSRINSNYIFLISDF